MFFSSQILQVVDHAAEVLVPDKKGVPHGALFMPRVAV